MIKILLKLKWYLRHSTKINEDWDNRRRTGSAVTVSSTLQPASPRLCVVCFLDEHPRRAPRFSFRSFCRPSPLPDPPDPYIILCCVPATSPRLRQPCPCPRVGHNDFVVAVVADRRSSPHPFRRRPQHLSCRPWRRACPLGAWAPSRFVHGDMGTWGFFGFSSWPLTVTSRGFACRHAFCNERSRSWRNSAVEEINDSDVGKPIKVLLSGQWWQRQDNNRHCFLSAGQLERSFSGACVDRQPASPRAMLCVWLQRTESDHRLDSVIYLGLEIITGVSSLTVH